MSHKSNLIEEVYEELNQMGVHHILEVHEGLTRIRWEPGDAAEGIAYCVKELIKTMTAQEIAWLNSLLFHIRMLYNQKEEDKQ